MAKAIVVTGSVCSGKTTLARKLTKLLDYGYIDVKEIIRKNKGIVAGYDRKRKTRDIDVKKLNRILISLIKKCKKPLVIDSHLSHYLPKEYVKLCIVCECSSLKKLKARLKKRKYTRLKITENLEAEILETCLVEALEAKHKVIVVDSSGKIDYKSLVSKA